jgi:hypothetical protein
MTDAPFSSEERRALDRFEPPALATGFADRALERVRARDEADLPPLPKRSGRWRAASPWRRGGALLGALAGVSLVSAAAAATGVFGEPVEVPVISPIARSLDIVPAPVARAAPPAQAAAPAAQPGVGLARERIDALIDDPAFRALPPLERRAELRRTARDLVDSGEARPREVVDALRETGRERLAELPPAQREQLVDAIVERREARREGVIGTTPAERRQMRRQIARERRAAARAPDAAPLADDAAGGSDEQALEASEGLAADGR